MSKCYQSIDSDWKQHLTQGLLSVTSAIIMTIVATDKHEFCLFNKK